jgi:hypothetical protein
LRSFFHDDILPHPPPPYRREDSFFIAEIWLHFLSEKGLHTNVRCICGLIFQCWNMTPSLVQEKDCTKKLNVYFG